ncbi:hypothetical protein QTG54_003957 [Skeletonema marinoi]|uniref:Uncharacterized protein n=1 Tax=Skeletonema marinoi TaxID=267567 RepID=A0AAD8YDS9_9STRA|nr:hypothetical protein QTG54_003957 [Skeletonema marinoi]
MEANCHFLHHQVKQRTTTTTNNNLQASYINNHRWHLSIPVAFLSIRGGSSDEREDKNTNNLEDDNFSVDFVSSFESELMEIRQEAELEAEAELEKLRLMLGEEEDDDEEESDLGSSEVEDDDTRADGNEEEDDNTIEPEEGNITDDEQNDGDEESSVVVVEEAVEEEEAKDVSDVEESAGEEEETKDVSDEEERISHTAINEEDQLGDKDEGIAGSEIAEEEIGDIKENVVEDEAVGEADDSSAKEDTVSATDDSDSKKQGKTKRSKAKKSKSSKPTSKSKKSSRQLLDDIGSLSEGELGTGDSVVLTRTVEIEVESRPRGISSFLKSDLVRALSLLIATIIVSVMMQRVQRQMEAQGL